MFFTIEKFERRVKELEKRRYLGQECIAPFASLEGDLGKDDVYREIPEKIEGPAFDLHDHFTGRDRYLWL